MDSLEPASSMPSSSASPGISSDNYDDLTSAEDFSFPWKQREILTFDIPVHDSERAGLGVSVKGKTSTNKGMYDFHEKSVLIVRNKKNYCIIIFSYQMESLILEFSSKVSSMEVQPQETVDLRPMINWLASMECPCWARPIHSPWKHCGRPCTKKDLFRALFLSRSPGKNLTMIFNSLIFQGLQII